ncbi:hypothetical protein Tco_1155438 [Tanacetum coccineum]
MKKQTIVTNSTTEAEYVATANCCGQVLWIQNQMLDYGFNFMNTKIYIDNESTICIVKNPMFHSKTKHIEMRHHFIKDSYEKRLIQVIKIHTNYNVADLLTKAFDVSRIGTAMKKLSTDIEVGEDSDHPTDSTQVPILDQPFTTSKPKKKQPSKKTQRQEAEVSQDETEHEESVPTPSNDPQPSGEDSMQLTDLMVLCTKLQTQVLDLEKAKDAQAKEIAALKKRVQKLERKKTSRTTDTDDMPVKAKVDKKDEQSTKLDDSTTSEVVTTASVENSVVPTTIEEITLAQTLIQIKEAKPKVVTSATTTTTTIRPKAKGVVVQEPSEFRVPQEAQPSIYKDKGKGIMIEPKVPLKIKDQIALDEQFTRDIQAKLDVKLIEEQKLAKKQEEKANIALIESW